jgi:diketogulonate reductase-like aldo/keto reductase
MNIPQLIYGTAWKKERTPQLVTQAWQAGFRGFDTACQPKHYREDLVGEALLGLYAKGESRDNLYIQTKFTPINGQDPKQIPYAKNASLSQQIQQSFRQSQQNLHTTKLNGYLLHSPILPFEKTLEAWETLEQFYDQGLVDYLGISNCYDLALLTELFKNSRIKPKIVQNRFYATSGYDREIRQWCRQNNLIYQSFWTLTANPHILEHPVVVWLARQKHKTPAQIWFRFVHQIGITPLTGTSDLEHMQEDLDIVNFSLADEDILNIEELLKPT